MILIWNSTLEINVFNLHMIMQIYVTFCVLIIVNNFFKFIHIIELQKLFVNNKCKFTSFPNYFLQSPRLFASPPLIIIG